MYRYVNCCFCNRVSVCNVIRGRSCYEMSVCLKVWESLCYLITCIYYMVDLIVSFFSVILKTNSSFHIDYIARLYNKFQICFLKLSSPSVPVSGIADYLVSSTFLKNYLDSNYFIKSSMHFVITIDNKHFFTQLCLEYWYFSN